MVERVASGERICGLGERGTAVLDAEGWRPGGDAPALPESVDAATVGTAEALRLPEGEARFVGTDRPFEAGDLREGVHRLAVEGDIETLLAFAGPATVESRDEPWLRFPAATPVAVGFRESLPPRPTVTVPATPSGLATAVTAAGRTHSTAGPERSHPGFRPRTPRVRFGEESVPDALAGDGDGPRMTVPASSTAVLVAAPLAYYLGAELRVEAGSPSVRGEGLEHAFAPPPSFAGEVADALRGLCCLDTRLRSVPGESGRLLEGEIGRLASAPPARRLAAVLRSPTEALPEWPLAAYVDDATDGRYLPYLLDRLSLVHPARASSLDPKALLKRSLDEFYRGRAPNVEAVDPSLADARAHAWLGEGTPVDAYTLVRPESPRGASARPDGLRVDVVCNEPEMGSERDVADVYRERLSGRGVDVRVHERLARRDLAAVFERPTDLVHFVGHCEVGGLVCPDGTLAAADLEACRAESFFLNACGSYHEGYEFVRRGATVGAVTLSAVLDEQAVTLGTAFAELLAAGYAFDRALSLARGEIIVGRDYVVVGDGTHRLRVPRGTPGVCHLREVDEGFVLRYEATAPDAAGRRYRSPVDGREHLCGEPVMTTLDREAASTLLGRLSVPVRYDGRLQWSDELAATLPASGQQS